MKSLKLTKKEKKRLYEQMAYVPNAELHDQVARASLMAMIMSAPIADRADVDKRVWAKVAWDFADAFMLERDTRP